MPLPNQRHLFDLLDDVAYFRCAAAAPQLKSVCEAGHIGIDKKSHPWTTGSYEAFAQVEQARQVFADLIGASADDVLINPSASYGIATAARNLQIGPGSPLRWRVLMLKGATLRMLGRHEEGVMHCRRDCQFPDTVYLPHMHFAAVLAEAESEEIARIAVERATRLQPALSLSYIRNQFENMHDTSLNSLLDSLRKAGLPE